MFIEFEVTVNQHIRAICEELQVFVQIPVFCQFQTINKQVCYTYQ